MLCALPLLPLLLLTCGNGRPLQAGASVAALPPLVVQLEHGPRQELRVNWSAGGRQSESASSSSSRPLAFRVQVARSSKYEVVSETNVTVIDDRGPWNWTWRSEWPLQCADHWVRVAWLPRHLAQTSWSEWKGIQGFKEPEEEGESSNVIQMFPVDTVLKEGLIQGFCCIPPKGRNITSIIFDNIPYPLVEIGDGVRGTIVQNLSATTEVGVVFRCKDSVYVESEINYVSFPPQKPRNLSCETQNLITVNCTWDPGRLPNLAAQYKHTYTLQIWNSSTGTITCHNTYCKFNTIPGWKEYTVTVMVANSLGQESENYVFNITDIVSPTPMHLSVVPGVRCANVSWLLEGNFSGMDLICLIKTGLEDSTLTEYRFQGLANKRYESRVDRLRPYTQYNISVSCSQARSTRGWRTWVSSGPFTTQMEAPKVTLNLWMTVDPFDDSRNVTLLWKTDQNSSEASVIIQHYQVTWEDLNQQKQLFVSADKNRAKITIGQGKCKISVKAVNEGGISIPAYITVPPKRLSHPIEIKRVKNGTLQGFLLSWAANANATCGYTVEWDAVKCYNMSDKPEIQWKTVPVECTSLVLPADTFTFCGGCRYTFSIFGCTRDGYLLLEKQEGYTEEHRPTSKPYGLHVVYNTTNPPSAILRWTFPDNDSTHPGFITGYLVTVQHRDGSQTGPRNITVDDPCKKSCGIPDLQADMEYTITVRARTAAGLGPRSELVKNHPNHSGLSVKILIALLVLPGTGLLMCILYRLLKDYVLGVFCEPVKITIKLLELDKSLYEASEKIRAVQVEDCPCCDISVLETPKKPIPKGNGTHLLYYPQAAVRHPSAVSAFSCITNMTYFSFPSEQDSYTADPCDLEIVLGESCGESGGYISTADVVSA